MGKESAALPKRPRTACTACRTSPIDKSRREHVQAWLWLCQGCQGPPTPTTNHHQPPTDNRNERSLGRSLLHGQHWASQGQPWAVSSVGLQRGYEAGDCVGGPGQPRMTHPLPHIRKIIPKEQPKLIKGAGNWRPIGGTFEGHRPFL